MVDLRTQPAKQQWSFAKANGGSRSLLHRFMYDLPTSGLEQKTKVQDKLRKISKFASLFQLDNV